MLRDTFVDNLMKRLGNSQDTTLRDDIISEMVFVQENILEGDVLYPWFLISEETSLDTVADDIQVALPADFLGLWGDVPLYRYDDSLDDPYVEMARDDWGVIAKTYNYSDAPTHWDIAGSNLLLRPIPDAVYPLRLWYMKRGSSLAGNYGDAANIENVWLQWASDWFMGEVGLIIAEQYLQMQPARVKRFETMALRGRDRVRVKSVAMEEELKVRIIGG